MKCLAIVPARSGSKGLRDKNIRPLLGKPLMAYTLEAAVASGIFDEVMVSTDSRHYADIAMQTPGVHVPFLRSADHAGDTSSTWDVIREVLHRYEEQGRSFDAFCILQPTSPMRTAAHIQGTYQLFREKRANSVVSVCELDHSINICNQLPEDHSLVGFVRNPDKYARQMNPTYYRLNGAIYLCDTRAFLASGDIYREKSYAYLMSREDSVDIDTADDLHLAEAMLEKRLGIVHPTFETYARIRQALDIIHSGAIDHLTDGWHELADGIRVHVFRYQTQDTGLFVAHRREIDIHYLLSGEEAVEIAPLSGLTVTSAYDPQTDALLGKGSGRRVLLTAGQIDILMPEEAHCVGLTAREPQTVRKAVIKVRI